MQHAEDPRLRLPGLSLGLIPTLARKITGRLMRLGRRQVALRRLARGTLTVRQLGAADADDIGRLVARSDGLGLKPGDFHHIDRTDSHLHVAWLDDEPIGVCFVQWAGPRCSDLAYDYEGVPEFYRLKVLDAYRSRGVGTQLIERIERQARERGVEQLGLGVRVANHRARALYRRLGYTGEVRDFTDDYLSVFGDGEPVRRQVPSQFLVKSLDGI